MKQFTGFLFLLIVVIVIILSLSGCSQYIDKRNVKRLESYAIQYRPDFLRLSNQINPCFTGKAKSDTTTTFGKADTTISFSKPMYLNNNGIFSGVPALTSKDTLINLQDGDIQLLPDGAIGTTLLDILPTKTVTIKIPIYTTIHDTVVDQRKVKDLRAQLTGKSDSLVIVKTQYQSVNHKKNIYLWILIGLGVLVTIYSVYKVYAFFSGGAIVKGVSAIEKKL